MFDIWPTSYITSMDLYCEIRVMSNRCHGAWLRLDGVCCRFLRDCLLGAHWLPVTVLCLQRLVAMISEWTLVTFPTSPSTQARRTTSRASGRSIPGRYLHVAFFSHFSLRVYCMVFERFVYPSFKVVCMVSIEPHFDSLFHRRRWKCETWKCGKENSAFKFELFEPLCKTNLNS